ncbi:MAG: hypothetical protein ACK4RK_18570 [Gemmataceae bacterium]
MDFNPERVRQNVRQATTQDLLDRITVYRAGMEAEAIEIILIELGERGVTDEEIGQHEAKRRAEVRFLDDGTAIMCSFCHHPAVAEGWGWHRLWGRIPVFPRYLHYCQEHMPVEPECPEEKLKDF